MKNSTIRTLAGDNNNGTATSQENTKGGLCRKSRLPMVLVLLLIVTLSAVLFKVDDSTYSKLIFSASQLPSLGANQEESVDEKQPDSADERVAIEAPKAAAMTRSLTEKPPSERASQPARSEFQSKEPLGGAAHQQPSELTTPSLSLSRPPLHKKDAFSFHPSIDPPPSQMTPRVKIPQLPDHEWSSAWAVGASAVRKATPNINDLMKSFDDIRYGQRPTDQTQTEPLVESSVAEDINATSSPSKQASSQDAFAGFTDGQLLMAELYHVYRQSLLATEVLACAHHVHMGQPDTDYNIGRHARVLAAALEDVAAEFRNNRSVSPLRELLEPVAGAKVPKPNAVAEAIANHPFLRDEFLMTKRYYQSSRSDRGVPVRVRNGDNSNGVYPLTNDVAVDKMCVKNLLTDPQTSSFFRSDQQRRLDQSYHLKYGDWHMKQYHLTCVSPHTGQAMFDGRHTLSRHIPTSSNPNTWLQGTLQRGYNRLATTVSSSGDQSDAVSCYWSFTDDAFAASDFVVRALVRAPNLLIFVQSPTFSDYGFHICGGDANSLAEGGGGEKTKADPSSPPTLNTPTLCLHRRAVEFEGFSRHSRVIAMPHIDRRDITDKQRAVQAQREFLERFAPGSARNVGDAFAADAEVGSDRKTKGTSFVTDDPNAPPIRLLYRSVGTGYAPLFHFMSYVWMGSNRDVFIVRQREINRMVLSELRGFFYFGGEGPSDTSLVVPPFGELLAVTHQLLRHFHQVDRTLMISSLRNVDLYHGNVGGGEVGRDVHYYRHLLEKRLPTVRRDRVETELDCTTVSRSAEECAASVAIFNRSLSRRRIVTNVATSGQIGHAHPRSFDVVANPHMGVALPHWARSSNAPSNEPMSHHSLEEIERAFGSSRVELHDQMGATDFMIDVDGNSNAFNSLVLKLCLGKPVFKVMSSGHHVQWFYKYLVNGEHLYLLPHGSIAKTMGEWLSNQTVEQAARVGRNGRRFCEQYFRDRGHWESMTESLVAEPWKKVEEQRAMPVRIRGEPHISMPLI